MDGVVGGVADLVDDGSPTTFVLVNGVAVVHDKGVVLIADSQGGVRCEIHCLAPMSDVCIAYVDFIAFSKAV
jgi:hypothetical protein